MTRSAEEIQSLMVARISELVGVAPEEIDVTVPVTRFGLDSVALIALAADLEKWLGYQLRENPLDTYPTIEALAQFLADQVSESDETG